MVYFYLEILFPPGASCQHGDAEYVNQILSSDFLLGNFKLLIENPAAGFSIRTAVLTQL